MSILNISSNTSLSSLNDGDTVLADASGGSIIIILPSVIEISEINIKKIDLTNNSVTIRTKGPFDRINGKTSLTLSEYNNTAVLVSDRESLFFTESDSFLLNVEADEAIHFYISKSGSDSNDGSEYSPFLTIQRAIVDVENLIQSSRPDRDIVVEIGNGDYAENVYFDPGLQPRRRVIFRGNRDSMTFITSGSTTSGSTTNLQASASFGTSEELVGLICTVYDPNDKIATQQWFTIRSHINTQIDTVDVFSPAIKSGWTYEVYSPAVRILGEEVDDPYYHASFMVNLNWSGNSSGWLPSGRPGPKIKPEIALMFLTFDRSFNSWGQCLGLFGGDIRIAGCLITGNEQGVDISSHCAATAYGPNSYGYDDPVHGLAGAFDYKLSGLSLGIRCTSPYGVVSASGQGTVFYGCVGIKITNAIGFWATYGGKIIIIGGSLNAIAGTYGVWITNDGLVQLGSYTIGPLPFLIKGCVEGLRMDGAGSISGPSCAIMNAEFQSISSHAINAKKMARLQIDKCITSGVSGTAVVATAGTLVKVANTVSMTGSAGDIVADSVSMSWASLVQGNPCIGADASRVFRG